MNALEPLGFLLTSSPLALEIPTLSGRSIALSPMAAGTFAGAFWAMVFTSLGGRGLPYRWYTLMISYAVAATVLNAGLARFAATSLSPIVAFATAAFAGAGIGVYLASPVLAVLRPRFARTQPAGGAILVALPSLLVLLALTTHQRPVAFFLLGSAILGLPTALLAINAGILLGLSLKPQPAMALALAGVPGELLFAAMVPAALRAL